MAQIAPPSLRVTTHRRPADVKRPIQTPYVGATCGLFLASPVARAPSRALNRGRLAEIDKARAVPGCTLFPRHDGAGTHAPKPAAGAGPAAFAPPGRGAHDRR